jgi:hypothetical protein
MLCDTTWVFEAKEKALSGMALSSAPVYRVFFLVHCHRIMAVSIWLSLEVIGISLVAMTHSTTFPFPVACIPLSEQHNQGITTLYRI